MVPAKQMPHLICIRYCNHRFQLHTLRTLLINYVVGTNQSDPDGQQQQSLIFDNTVKNQKNDDNTSQTHRKPHSISHKLLCFNFPMSQFRVEWFRLRI